MQVQFETAAADVVAMDPLEYYKYADVPMCEFWHPIQDNFVGSLNFKPIKPTASAAHIYGKKRVAAESFTSFDLNWDEHWEMLKEVANLNMTEGVTHNVFHTYTHNPQVGFLPPGTSFGNSIGTPFLRGQTWWKYMPWFTSFLSRTSDMLERGKPVVDVLPRELLFANCAVHGLLVRAALRARRGFLVLAHRLPGGVGKQPVFDELPREFLVADRAVHGLLVRAAISARRGLLVLAHRFAEGVVCEWQSDLVGAFDGAQGAVLFNQPLAAVAAVPILDVAV